MAFFIGTAVKTSNITKKHLESGKNRVIQPNLKMSVLIVQDELWRERITITILSVTDAGGKYNNISCLFSD
jgi:hypothetical protein